MSERSRVSLVDLNRAAHRRLMHFNRRRMQPATVRETWRDDLHHALRPALTEGQFLEAERCTVQPMLCDVPPEPEAFMAWFETLRQHGPGQGDGLFDWLEHRASRPQMRWFVKQEIVGEAGFD